MGERKSAGKALLNGLGGIIVFLILFGILYILAKYVPNQTFQQVFEFLSQNLTFILLISFIMLFGDVFSALPFPLNILYPLFNAVGGALWVIFIYNIFQLIDFFVGQNISGLIEPFYSVALIVVFLIILIVGYSHVLASARPKRKQKPMQGVEKGKEVSKQTNINTRERSNVEWKDVGEEIKEASYNLATTIKKKLEPKSSKKTITKKAVKKKAKKKAKKTAKKKSKK